VLNLRAAVAVECVEAVAVACVAVAAVPVQWEVQAAVAAV
jgi:hypothetical protein